MNLILKTTKDESMGELRMAQPFEEFWVAFLWRCIDVVDDASIRVEQARILYASTELVMKLIEFISGSSLQIFHFCKTHLSQITGNHFSDSGDLEERGFYFIDQL